MLYIKYTKDYYKEFMKESELPRYGARVIYFWKILTGDFLKKNLKNGELIVLPRINKRTVKRLLNYLKIYSAKTVCLSENLRKTEIKDKIENLDIKVLDGSWLYKYLTYDVVEFITKQKNAKMENQEVSILTSNITELEIEIITRFCENCKNVNIVTKEEKKLKRLEEYLYEENGIILNVTENYSKSLIKSDFIINMNLSEEQINQYTLPRKAVIITVSNNAKITSKGFDGVNIFSYKLKKFSGTDNEIFKGFNRECIAESILYRNTHPRNIMKQIKELGIEIESCIGFKGEIKKSEYNRLKKKEQKI